MKKQLLLLVVILLPMVVRGYDFQNDGIYYNIMDNENHTLYVTYAYPNEKNSDSYTGDIVVPEEVIHNGIKYTVFGIGTQAFKFCNKVTSVVLPQSIVNLSNNAFENCSSLNSINIPESVPYIGSYSFSGCKNLTSINGGSGVIGIQDYAFQNCSALTTINMFTNLASIEGGAFKGCTGLTSVIIPKSVKSIRNNPFPDCPNITSIEVEDANEYYDSRNDCNAIVDTKNNTLLSGCMNTSIPEDAVKIGDDAFSGCVGLTSITIPESVSSIGSCAFLNCSGLTSITIPNRVTYIGGAVFSGCSGLSSIIVEKDNTRYDSRNDCNAIIDKKNNTLLSGCMNTVIPEDVVKIGNTAFSGCCGLTSLDIPNSITSIESYAFSGCTGLPSLYISMNVSYIAETAFEGCTGISSIIVDPNNSIYDSRDNCNAIVKGNMLILACDNTVLPLNVTSFSWYAFCNCSTVEIPDGVESMPYNMFYNCPHLKLIKIPKSVKSIEPSSINECNNLKTIIFEDGEDELKFTNTYISEPEWIIGCSLDSLYIGRNINYKFTKSNQTYDYYSPFRNNETLRVVKFNSNIIDLQNNYFSGCTNLTSVYLPDNLKSIGSGAFSRCSSLQSIEFNSNLDSISYSAFYGCSSLKKIVIPSNVRTIGSNAFANTNLSELIIEEDDKDIDMIEAGSEKYICSGASIDYVYWGRNGAAINYKKIKHLVLGNINHFSKVGANIGPFSYYKGCDTINVLSIRSSSDTLHFVVDEKVNYSQWTYNYTLPFKDIHIDSVYCDRVIDVYDSYNTGRTFYPFEGVNSSFKLAIGNSITDISNNMFAGCKIPSVLIPKNINRIGLTAFYGCSTLSKLIIEDSMEPINIEDGNTFYACPLKNMYIGRNINYPSNNSPFKSHKEGVESLIIGENVTEIGIEEFYGLKNLTSIALPNSLKKIGSMAFYGCDGLTELAIPSSVNEIGQQAFDLCRGLKTLTFEDGEEELAFTAEPNFINNSFCNSPLEKIYLGRNIIYTNVSPFSVMESIKELTLGSKVTRLSKGAFGGCPNLKEVYSNAETIPTTEENVFTESYLANATLHVPYSLYDEYRVTYPWSKFGNMFNYEGKYNLFYVVDEVEYKKYVVNEGDAITPEAEPTKEGYTFSGWSEIPATMPAHDVTVTGTFTINKYKLIYTIDDEEYKTYEIEYGTTINPEADPTKEGYTFSGWSEIPETMPANDVFVTGSFTINKYQVTYIIDGEIYYTDNIEYASKITPPSVQDKEGYTFSWNEYPETMPANDITITGSFAINGYILSYYVDGVVYKTIELEYNSSITPEEEPTKEGYTFSGWSEIPETMPAHDVTIYGSFAINSYLLTYSVDGEIVKSDSIAYNTVLTPIEDPTKEGYTFSGWSDIPETMPAHDVTVTGSFTVNKYKLIYKVDGEVIKSYDVEFGATIIPEAEPTKEGYTFSGWSEIPATMPAHDVTVTGTFTQETGINQIMVNQNGKAMIFTIDGKRVDNLKKGLNVIRMKDGTMRKVVVK